MPDTLIPARRPFRSTAFGAFLSRLVHHRVGFGAAIVILLITLAAVFAPLIAAHPPNELQTGPRLATASGSHWFGTDSLGRDLFSRLLHGARISLLVGLLSVSLSAVIGTLLGVIAGYYSGWRDTAIMRFMDVLFAFPAILLALLTLAVLGQSTRNVIIAITIVFIPGFARVARAPALSVMTQPYIEVLRCAGAGDRRLILRHVVPNVLAPVLVQFTVNLSYAILIEASLSYLGLGIKPPNPSWGNIISDGQQYLLVSPGQVLYASAILAVTIGAFNLLGDALRDITDPRERRSA